MTDSTERPPMVAFIEARLVEDEAQAQAAIDSLRRSSLDSLTYDGDLGTWTAETSDGGAGIHAEGVTVREDETNEWSGSRTVIFSGDGEPSAEVAGHIARNDPARTLREIAAKRKAVDWFLNDDWVVMEPTIQAIAAIWSDHPDYQPEWMDAEEEQV